LSVEGGNVVKDEAELGAVFECSSMVSRVVYRMCTGIFGDYVVGFVYRFVY